jgi:hypothetical protein
MDSSGLFGMGGEERESRVVVVIHVQREAVELSLRVSAARR